MPTSMNLFHHESQREPPALSSQGKLMSDTKSTLLNCLPAMSNPGCRDASMESTVVLFDMATIIHMVKPQRARITLLENIHKCSYCHSWKASWQNVAHESMQCGTHITFLVSNHRHISSVAKLLVVEQVSSQIPLPKGSSEWQRFLNDSANKDALFKFLSDELHRNTSEARYFLLTTKAEGRVSSKQQTYWYNKSGTVSARISRHKTDVAFEPCSTKWS